MRPLKASLRGFIVVLVMTVAVILSGASPRPGRQNQAMLPVFVLARLRLYGKVPVLY